MTDPLRNPLDPIRKAGPEAGRELFYKCAAASRGFPNDAVQDAAINMLVNAIRQNCATRKDASDAVDELFAKTKALLLNQHYDSLGRRRNVFPFHQRIDVPLLVND